MKAASQPVLAASSDRLTQALEPALRSGIDLMEVGRFEREMARRGDSLIEELFSPAERAWCARRRRPAEGYAMAYAAKEALFKALGTGKVGRMAWRDVEIGWLQGDAEPAITLTGETAAVAEQLALTDVHCAVASTRHYGIAWVVVAGRGSCPGRFHLSSRELRLSSLRANGKRPGHPRPDAGVTGESRTPSPEPRQ